MGVAIVTMTKNDTNGEENHAPTNILMKDGNVTAVNKTVGYMGTRALDRISPPSSLICFPTEIMIAIFFTCKYMIFFSLFLI